MINTYTSGFWSLFWTVVLLMWSLKNSISRRSDLSRISFATFLSPGLHFVLLLLLLVQFVRCVYDPDTGRHRLINKL